MFISESIDSQMLSFIFTQNLISIVIRLWKQYAKDMCEKLALKGWIRVSPRGTIYGQIQGEKSNVDEMCVSSLISQALANWEKAQSLAVRERKDKSALALFVGATASLPRTMFANAWSMINDLTHLFKLINWMIN